MKRRTAVTEMFTEDTKHAVLTRQLGGQRQIASHLFRKVTQ